MYIHRVYAYSYTISTDITFIEKKAVILFSPSGMLNRIERRYILVMSIIGESRRASTTLLATFILIIAFVIFGYT